MSIAQRQMLGTYIFIIETGGHQRLLERIEAAIAIHFYEQEDTLFDHGMKLMPRWKTEEPLIAIFQCSSKLIRFPFKIEF